LGARFGRTPKMAAGAFVVGLDLSETSASPPRDGREGLWAGASHLEAGAVRGLCPGAARRRRGPRLRFAGRRSGALRGERWGVRHGEEGCTRRVALVRSVRRWDRGVDPLGEERRVLRAPQQRWKTATLQTRKRFFGCRTAALRSARAAARLLGVHPARRAARVVRVVERHVVYPPRAVTPARVVRPAVAQVSRHLLGAWKGGARQCGLCGGREWRAL